MTSPAEFADLRHASPALFDRVLALNGLHAAETSELDARRLRGMLDAAFMALVAPDASAFLIAFDETAAYDSPNFLWFRDRLDRFVYVDRVVVAATARGRGLARRLYDDVAAAALASSRDRVVCEVNLEPPNPASDAFHAALGFFEAGRGSPAPGKVVRYLERRLPPEDSP